MTRAIRYPDHNEPCSHRRLLTVFGRYIDWCRDHSLLVIRRTGRARDEAVP